MAREQQRDPHEVLRPLILCDDAGREYVNPARARETAVYLQTEDWPLVVAAGQSGTTTWRAPKGRGGAGGLEIKYLSAHSNVPFLCKLRDPDNRGGWYYSNQPIHHNLMFGKGGRPFELARSIYVPAQDFVEANVTSRASALSGNFSMCAEARWLRRDVADDVTRALRLAHDARRSRPFWLTNDLTSITLTALQSNAEVWMTMPGSMRLVSGFLMAESTGPFEVDIYEYEGGDQITYGGPIDSRIICGDGARPAKVPGALITQPIEQLYLRLTDLSGAANTVFLTFHGVAMDDEGKQSGGDVKGV